MGLETAPFISSLVATNPVQTDLKRQGDDHLRLVKAALQATLPNADKAFYFPTSEAKSANFTITAAHQDRTFVVTTSGGNVIATLPTLASGDAGWECSFIKVGTDTNAIFVTPASGTLQSGDLAALAKTRRAIPGVKTNAYWTGSAWMCSRACQVPVGTILDYEGVALPVGYEWSNGQTLSGTTTSIYPDYYTRGTTLITTDMCGRVAAGQDDMGGIASKIRLTGLTDGVNGDTLGAFGGLESTTLTSAESGQKAITAAPVAITDPGHGHPGSTVALSSPLGGSGVGGATVAGGSTALSIANNTTGITASLTLAGSNAVSAHNNVQPTIILNKIVVVE